MFKSIIYPALILLCLQTVLVAQSVCPVPDSLYNTMVTHQQAVIGWKAIPGVTSWEVMLTKVSKTRSDTFFIGTAAPQVVLGADKIKYGNFYKYKTRAICASDTSQWSLTEVIFIPPDCSAWPLLQCGDALQLPFSEGFGQSTIIYNCKNNIYPDGTENILNFTISPTETNRYFIFKPNHKINAYRVYLRRVSAVGPDCIHYLDPAWRCLQDSMIGETIRLRNLAAGDYQLWVKRESSYQPDTLNVEFLCSLPCNPPKNTRTIFSSNGGNMELSWEDALGPWYYEVALRKDSSHAEERRIVPNAAEALQYFPGVEAENIYAWRVRKICDRDTSGWSRWNRFKTNPIYGNPPLLSCPTATFVPPFEANPYAYWDDCSGTTGFGYKIAFVRQFLGDSPYQIVARNKQNRPFRLGYGRPSNCCPVSCFADSVATLASPGEGHWFIYVMQDDTLPAEYTIDINCPCFTPVQYGGGISPNGIGSVRWYFASDLIKNQTVEIERQLATAPFTGQSNYQSALPLVEWNDLDYAKNYYCRLRALCDPPESWGDTIDLMPAFDCNRLPKLSCGQPLRMILGKGYGQVAHVVAGTGCLSQERYATFTPTATNFYEFTAVRRRGNATARMGLFEGCTYTSEPPYSTDGSPLRVLLQSGQTYTLVLDKAAFETRGEFEVTVNCTGDNFDRPYNAQGNLTAQALALSDSNCEVYSNVGATSDFIDPLPTIPAGNWKDGPEHTVWFSFTAPFSGTVRISVKSSLDAPMDPQVALIRADSFGFFPQPPLAAAEDFGGNREASLSYSGLIPGKTYLVMVDGAGGSTGRFCIQINGNPLLFNRIDTCATFVRDYKIPAQPDTWINFYGAPSAYADGPLLLAMKTSEALGPVSVSIQKTALATPLANGLKLLPRYFNINTTKQPQSPVTLRLFFTREEYEKYRFTAPFPLDSVPYFTYYDGTNEDCTPFNNSAPPTEATQFPKLVWINSDVFYIEGTTDHFSEFGAGGRVSTDANEATPATSWKVYPIPTREGVWVERLLPEAMDLQISITAVSGVRVWQTLWSPAPGQQKLFIPTASLPSGVYQMRLLDLRSGTSVVRTLQVVAQP